MIDGGRAAILESTRQFNADGSVTKRPFDHVTAAGDGAGFHHMHRLDLLMCLYKRVFEFGPDSGAPCPITVHMDCRLTQLGFPPCMLSKSVTGVDGQYCGRQRTA